MQSKEQYKDYENLLTTSEVADIAGVHPVTIRNWYTKNDLKIAVRVGKLGRRLFHKEDVEEFLKKHDK